MPVDKFGSSGEHKPRVWPTRNCFVNMGDVRGWSNLRGQGPYALELTTGGVFRPFVIEPKVSDEPEWEVKLELLMPYMDLQSPSGGGIQKLIWLINSGNMLVGYNQIGTEPPVVSGHVNDYYFGPKDPGVAKLRAVTTFPKDLDILKHPPPPRALQHIWNSSWVQ